MWLIYVFVRGGGTRISAVISGWLLVRWYHNVLSVIDTTVATNCDYSSSGYCRMWAGRTYDRVISSTREDILARHSVLVDSSLLRVYVYR